ncbi:MAG TPA: flagellar filament capping protein FliD [Opitutaceae bacterium]|nr:flagellar filament capping protein FliD [Opitutaceae bacterium]
MAGLQLSGLASGFDWTSFVNQMMAVEHAPADRLAAEKATNTQKLGALTTLGTNLTDLNTAIAALKSDGTFASRKATSSNSTSSWTLNAADNTASGNYTIAVSQLATTAKRTGAAGISGSLAPTNDVASLTIGSLATTVPVTTPAGAFFTVNGQQITISATDSLKDVFDRIKSATGGDVEATYDAGTDKVTLASLSSSEIVLGAANDTSNFLSVMKLANNGTTNPITSSGTLGSVSLSAPLINAHLRSPITAVDSNGNGAFSINGVSIAYNVNHDSLATILSRIGASSAGVTANYDAANDQVVLTNKSTGDTGLTVSDGSGGLLDALGLVAGSTAGGTLVHGKNANFTVNGGPTLTSTSNKLDASAHGITGLSVTVNSESTETISVAADTASMKSKIQDFVTKFNAVEKYIDDQTTITTTNGKVTTSLLSDNREVQDWSSSLRSLAFNAVSGLSGTISKLGDLGIGFTSTDSQLSITDPAALDDALTNHASDVAAFFGNTATGLVGQFTNFFVKTIGASTTSIANPTIGGYLGSQESDLTKANTGIDQQIADIERRLVEEKATMTASFQAMETAMSSIKNTQALLTSTYGTTSATNSGASTSTSTSSATG